MSFKVPSLPKLWKRVNPQEQFKEQCKGLPISEFKSLEILGTVASGSFGIVKLCKKNEEKFVLKELMNEDAEQKRLFIKEANLLHQLHHENIVKFHSVLLCENRKYAFLMEYMHFDFSHFGNDSKVSTLKDLLYSLDNYCNFSGFEHLSLCVAKDICSGLAFLHRNDVVHRDLKPDNVLVSNQHYSKDTISKFWETKPLIAKLTDFGESRSKLIQTSTLLHSKTVNINRGTPVFMAPEICRQETPQMTLEHLKMTDVWSLSMIFFLLINPDRRYPYEEEIRNMKKSGITPAEIMKCVYTNCKLPVYSEKYAELRINGPWNEIEKVYLFSAKFENRPAVFEVQSLLERKHKIEKRERNIFSDFGISSSSSEIKFDQKSMGTGSDDVEIPQNNNVNGREPSGISAEMETGDIIVTTNLNVATQKPEMPLQVNIEVEHTSCSEAILPQKRRKMHHYLKSEDNPFNESTLPSINHHTVHDTRLPRESRCVQETSDSGKTILCSYACDTNELQESPCSISQKGVMDFEAVMGHNHQSSPEIFKHAAAGAQCSTISLAAIVAACLKSVDSWNTDEIDEILQEGDALHLKILQSYDWPMKRSESKLDIDEMPDLISIKFNGFEADVSIGVLSDASFGFSSNLHSLIISALNSKPNKSFILRMFGSCVAILCGQYQEYFVFDPHSRNSKGEIDAEGSAGLFCFTNASGMISYLQRQCGRRNEQIDLYPIDAEILRIQECTRKEPYELNMSNIHDRVSQGKVQ